MTDDLSYTHAGGAVDYFDGLPTCGVNWEGQYAADYTVLPMVCPINTMASCETSILRCRRHDGRSR